MHRYTTHNPDEKECVPALLNFIVENKPCEFLVYYHMVLPQTGAIKNKVKKVVLWFYACSNLWLPSFNDLESPATGLFQYETLSSIIYEPLAPACLGMLRR